ncbi:MAG TPA: RluA family pseudouridine synthase [Polyangiaceae bacterium]|jgi:23S rRNA pseudouridine1911/1915/1917 synthase|nr:RluA family pseudouridine synthase [Polyangiaceae bacterium]
MTRLREFDASALRPPDVAEDSVVSVFRVPPEVAGQRLDVFVHSQLHRTSRTRAQVIVRLSAYDVSGRRLKPNDRVRAEQHILLWRAPWDETPVPVDVPVLYEDDHLMAVSKPALLPVHPTARYHKNTLIKVLQAARPDCAFLSLGHRLDRETSGVILLSKTRVCDRALKKQLADRDDIEKTYIALTWGAPDPGDGRTSFRCERRLELDPTSELRVKMRIRDDPSAQYASTIVDVEGVRRSPAGRTYARVRCTLETGRQHQIRVHLASLGAPVVGDKLYGPDERAFARSADGELTGDDLVQLELPRHALHAARLVLGHPITGRPLTIEAPLPADIADFWDALPA